MKPLADVRGRVPTRSTRTALRVTAKPIATRLCTGMLALAAALPSSVSRADTAGCTVVLCLANPAGWAAIGACVEPVAAWFRSLWKGFRSPSCSESGATFAMGSRVIGSTTNAEGVETPIIETFLVMRGDDGVVREIGGF